MKLRPLMDADDVRIIVQAFMMGGLLIAAVLVGMTALAAIVGLAWLVFRAVAGGL